MSDLKLEDCTNKLCPFSGDPVQADSLTEYQGKTVGFCNPGCRDNFAANPSDHPEAVAYFRATMVEGAVWQKTWASMSEAVANTPFAEVFQDRNIQIELYAPDKRDKQTPHDRDEVYLVISGSGRFRKGDEVVHFGPGDLIYVPKHEDHRFEEFTNDFKTWVIFYE